MFLMKGKNNTIMFNTYLYLQIIVLKTKTNNFAFIAE